MLSPSSLLVDFLSTSFRNESSNASCSYWHNIEEAPPSVFSQAEFIFDLILYDTLLRGLVRCIAFILSYKFFNVAKVLLKILAKRRVPQATKLISLVFLSYPANFFFRRLEFNFLVFLNCFSIL